MKQIAMIVAFLFIVLGFPLIGFSEPTRNVSDIPKDKLEQVPNALFQLKSGMTREQVRELMGTPEKVNMAADVWYPVKGDTVNQIKVLYLNNKAVRCTWISVHDNIHFILFG